MDKNFRIFAGRASLIGDTIMFLPVLNYLDIKYKNSYKIFPISQKTSQSAPLFINHPLIDRIHILGKHEGLSDDDVKMAQECNIAINPFPEHPDKTDWYNDYNCIEETVRMAGINLQDFQSMPEALRKPKLEKWFKLNKYEDTIAIWPFACYGVDTDRNPSVNWWKETLKVIDKKFNYTILHFGAENEPNIDEGISKYFKMTDLSFFEMIRITLGCKLSIGTDSGSSWVIGAYGFPQINLVLKNALNHIRNYSAFAPENYLNNKIDLIGLDGKDCITQDQIINSIEQLK
jgi:ADP-heptose:LPS heptosyltransferase